MKTRPNIRAIVAQSNAPKPWQAIGDIARQVLADLAAPRFSGAEPQRGLNTPLPRTPSAGTLRAAEGIGAAGGNDDEAIERVGHRADHASVPMAISMATTAHATAKAISAGRAAPRAST